MPNHYVVRHDGKTIAGGSLYGPITDELTAVGLHNWRNIIGATLSCVVTNEDDDVVERYGVIVDGSGNITLVAPKLPSSL